MNSGKLLFWNNKNRIQDGSIETDQPVTFKEPKIQNGT